MPNNPIVLLIPESTGYAIDSQGFGYKLATPPTAAGLTGEHLTGNERPTYCVHQSTPEADKLIILANGSDIMKIEHGDTAMAALGGFPPRGVKFVATLDTFVIAAGWNDMDFAWSKAEDAEDWERQDENGNITDDGTGDLTHFNRVLSDGEAIKMIKVNERDLYFFKSHSIEIWVNVGGDSVFARKQFINLAQDTNKNNKLDANSLAGHTVVFANDAPHFWYGGEFWRLNGNRPESISSQWRKYLDKEVKAPQRMYGFNYRKEHLIRWFNPHGNKCFVYDYQKNTWSEDNEWSGDGRWRKMRHNSYMELNRQAYVGDVNPTGKIYHWDRKYKTDDGDPIRVYRDLAAIFGDDGNDYQVNRLRLRFKRGVETGPHQQDDKRPNQVEGNDPEEHDPKLLVRWRMDKGDWQFYEPIDMGKKGQIRPWAEEDIYSLGIGREIEVELVETAAVDYLLTHLLVTAESLGA